MQKQELKSTNAIQESTLVSKCNCIMNSISSCEITVFKHDLRYNLAQTFPEEMHTMYKHLKKEWHHNTLQN